MVRVAYFDTSALLKKYVLETGSRWVQSYITSRPTPQVLTSSLTLVEASCAFARRLREGILTAATHITVEEAFDYDIQHKYTVLNFDPMVIKVARQLARQHPLRAYDAVHLATVRLANEQLVQAGKSPLTFVCADDRLLAIAQAEGLLVENPNHH